MRGIDPKETYVNLLTKIRKVKGFTFSQRSPLDVINFIKGNHHTTGDYRSIVTANIVSNESLRSSSKVRNSFKRY